MRLHVYKKPNVLVVLGIALFSASCNQQSALQTGKKVGDDIVVSLDNPDFTEQSVTLTPATTKWNGVMAREIDVTNSGFRVANGDFQVRTSNGDGPAKSNGTSTFGSVSNEDLPARPDAEGHYASNQSPQQVDLQAQGLRVGYTPLLVRLAQIEPDHSSAADFTTSRVRLDTSVSLVPVEVVVVFHDKDAQGFLNNGMESQRLPQQLAFWDHLPTVETTNTTDGQFGELTAAIHVMPWYRRDKEGLYHIGTQAAPDVIWFSCGVQFRLVNYFELQVPTRNVFPVRSNGEDMDKFWPMGTVDDAPLRENVALAKRDPRHMEGAVMVICMGQVGFTDAPEVGRALVGSGAIGVSLRDGRSTDGVVGHELGHLSGLGDASGTAKDAAGKPMFNVMVNPGPGVTPTEAECERTKQWASRFRKFWSQPHDPNEH